MILNMKVNINTCFIRGKNALESIFLLLVDMLVVSNSPVKIDGKKLKLERALNADGILCS